MLCEFRRRKDRVPGRQKTGIGESKHGYRERRTRVPGTERRSFIACRSLVRKRWITRLHEAGPQATDSLYHNFDSLPVSGRSQLLLAKQKMAMWGAPIRWPTPVGEAKDGDVGCADPMANSCWRSKRSRFVLRQSNGTGHGYRECKTRGSGYVDTEIVGCRKVSSYKDLKVWNKGA